MTHFHQETEPQHFDQSDTSLPFNSNQIDDINAMFQAEFDHETAIMNGGDFIQTERVLEEAKKKIVHNTKETTNALFKSISYRAYKARLAEMVRPELSRTGITPLDDALTDDETKKSGISLGNLIYIVGESGAGKTEFSVRLSSLLSNQVERIDINSDNVYKKVAHFNFEMGKFKVEKRLDRHGVNLDSYYIYESSTDIDDIETEIMALYVKGFKHFFVDSKFKITKKGLTKMELASLIGEKFQKLARELGINIYIIDQMSSENSSGQDRNLAQKHGNDATYEADYIFYLLLIPQVDEKGKPLKDDSGIIQNRDDSRMLIIKKDRETEHNGRRVILHKNDILPNSYNSFGATETHTYQEENVDTSRGFPIIIENESKIDLPLI